MTGEFAPFRWDGLSVNTDSFEATGEGPVTAVRAEGLHTEIGFGGVRRGVWEIRGSSVRRLEISLDATREIPAEPTARRPTAKVSAPKRSSWIPQEAELEELDIRNIALNATVKHGAITASGMSAVAQRASAKGDYRAEIEGGTVKLPFEFIPELRLDRLRLRYQDQRIFLTDATAGAFSAGRLQATGEVDLDTRQYALEGTATGLKCDDILNTDWSKRLTGNVSSTFAVDNRSGTPSATGVLTIQNGVLTALPVLDVLAAYADTRRFRELTLSEAHTRWRWQDGDISLQDLVIASEGLVRLEGNIDIRGKNLDGIFRLGIAPGTLSTIPGAETDVFLPGERGLLWTTLRIGGTTDDPKEDLTDRLIAAAGARMFEMIPETGEKALKFTRSLLGETPMKTIDKGVEIIGKGADTVGGIIDGFLGGGTPPPAKTKDAQ